MGSGIVTEKLKTINKVVLIETNLIIPNSKQPRKIFSEDEIKGLALSILENGLLQPLTVRKIGEKYELISGERRLRAIKLASIEAAPCIIMETTEKQSAVFALLENIQREDLNYFEEAIAIKSLIVEWGISQAELGSKIGKSQPTIANKLRLLRYDEKTQNLMINKKINERQARALLKINDQKKLVDAINYISNNKLNTAQTEKYIDTLNDTKEIHKKNFKPIVKDVRLFFNTMNNAIKLMNESGINVSAKKFESGSFIEYVVKIPR